MRFYAVLDTNVLVSAMLKTGSVPGRVLAEALNGDIIPVLNDGIIAEYEDVLNRPQFRFDKRAVKVFLDELKRRAVYTDAGLIEDEIPDQKDVVFYAVLMEKRKEEDAYLVTGNLKHFPIRTYIVTPREMLDILNEPQQIKLDTIEYVGIGGHCCRCPVLCGQYISVANLLQQWQNEKKVCSGSGYTVYGVQTRLSS